MPNVRSPPILEYLSYILAFTPFLVNTSAHASPAGPAPIIATCLSVWVTLDMSGFQPKRKASSVIYFSIEPIVTAPKPSSSVHAPSHSLS